MHFADFCLACVLASICRFTPPASTCRHLGAEAELVNVRMADPRTTGEDTMPVITPPSTPPTPNTNQLSDIFSDSPQGSPSLTSPNTEPSDINRLRSIHSTAGYRAGISKSKAESLQPGFDEGYSLGATFGLRIGHLLGVLEGLRNTLIKAHSEEAGRIKNIVIEAEKDLRLESVFGKEYWGEDGVWRYTVQGDQSDGGEKNDEISIQDIVHCHPLVKKWDAAVDAEMKRAGVNSKRFEGPEWERGRLEASHV